MPDKTMTKGATATTVAPDTTRRRVRVYMHPDRMVVRPWLVDTISENNHGRLTRYMTRRMAIDTAASYLASGDPRVAEAFDAYQVIKAGIVRDYRAKIEAVADQEPE